MTGPGPGAFPWGFELVVFALACLPLGEVFRRIGSRWAGVFRAADPIERALLDLYLAGATLFILASIPVPLFVPGAPGAILAVGAVGLVVLVIDERRSPRSPASPPVEWAVLRSPYTWALLACVLLLLGVEAAAATGAATGNTYDSSLYTTYVALLNLHHSVPYSFAPVASALIAYPQGTTVWFAAAQSTFGLAPARTPLLVTPLFLALAPLAAYVWGRRWLNSVPAGVAVGVSFALLVSWTRVLVSGSNDFVLAFPLVLLLWAWIPRWQSTPTLSWGDALAFGALVGYSAALNPVGAEVTLLALPVLALVGPSTRLRLGAWVARWLAAGLVAVLFVVPELAAVAGGPPGGNSFSPPGASVLSGGSFVGLVDPFLFRSTDVWLSPFPILRAELALLLVAGAVVLLLRPGPLRPVGIELPVRLVTMAIVPVVLLATQLAPFAAAPPFSWVGHVTNVSELSVLLFAVFGFTSAIPLALLFASPVRPPPRASPAAAGLGSPRPWRDAPPMHGAAVVPSSVAVLLGISLLIPGAVVTITDLPSYESTLYGEFGNVSTGDLDLLTWAGDHLPANATVFVAPGSAAEFLPGYLPTATLLYPMVGAPTSTAYWEALVELEQGRLTARGQADLASLHVSFIVVTQSNSILWRPITAAPLLTQSPPFAEVFHEGDAYLFSFTPTGGP